MDRTKGIAYCGLACCVCSENSTCAGCRNDGCTGKNWCKSFNCCKSRGLNGCWECTEFPCDNKMFSKLRVVTFAKFVARHGEEKLMDGLEENERKGVLYHYENQLVGDYDVYTQEEDIVNLICGNQA